MLEPIIASIHPADPLARDRARQRLQELTMPAWAMGRLLDLGVDLAGMTGRMDPPTHSRTVVVMAGDHGVAQQGVSQYPSDVTGQMVRNFVAGGAAINAMARMAHADVVVVDAGVAADLTDLHETGAVLNHRAGPGTADISQGPAMSPEQALECVCAGANLAVELAPSTDLFATGDMGIGNTTPSAAIAVCLTGQAAEAITGRGTGIDDDAWQAKVLAVQRALQLNHPDPADAMDVLAKVGGFEIGGLTGLILGAASQRRPVVVDGYISTAAALLAVTMAPACRDFLIFAHVSAEAGHQRMCRHLDARPLLDLDLRLGEGTGATLAFPLVEAAARLLTEVSTFEEAGVSDAGA